jgi:hypothetical protein
MDISNLTLSFTKHIELVLYVEWLNVIDWHILPLCCLMCAVQALIYVF